ncbi:MAG: cadherin repeat domain-containing protein [Planctomycetaceae bacterium]|nr:cadherin repeat domain-containing protein [Planctomycetaceae bacterium]
MLLRDWLVRLRHVVQGRSSRRMRRRPVRRSSASQVQNLETRQLLTLGAFGPEFQVNTTVTGDQALSDVPTSIAIDRDGDFVVTWTDSAADGSGQGVYVKRYDRAGNPLGVNQNAAQIRVNDFTTGNQRFSSVAVDAFGDFVVTWTSAGQDGSGDGIYARRFDKGGRAISAEFRVNGMTTADQVRSSVAMDTAGNFVIVWESTLTTDVFGNTVEAGRSVWARMYDKDGRAIDDEFKVNTITTGDQNLAHVALSDNGDFVITWTDSAADGSGTSVWARRYHYDLSNTPLLPDITALSGPFQVNTFTTGAQQQSAVAIDGDGDFAIVWQSAAQPGDGNANGVFARQYNNDGSARGAEFVVNEFTTGEQRNARIAMRNDGEFIVTWDSAAQDTNGDAVMRRRYNAAGTNNPMGGEVQVNLFTAGNQNLSSVGMSYDGDVVIAWNGAAQDGAGAGVFARKANESVEMTAPLFGGFLFHTDLLTQDEVILSPVDTLGAVFSEVMRTTGAGSVTNLANWELRLDPTGANVDVTSLINNITAGIDVNTMVGIEVLGSEKYQALVTFTSLLPPGDYRIILKNTVTDAEGVSLGQQSVDFKVRSTHAVGGEAQANDVTTNTQTNFAENPQSIAIYSSDDDTVNGDYIVTWSSSNQTGDTDYGVYFRKYDRSGTPLSATATRANVTTAGNQRYSSVATFSDGRFIVAWATGDTGASSSIFFRIFNADGTPATGFATDRQVVGAVGTFPAVATEIDGDFVITYTGANDGNGSGIFVQQFNANGTPKALPGANPINPIVPYRANTFITGTQRYSSISIDELGGFIVTWTSSGQDGDRDGIFGQRFDQFGVAAGPEFRVNTSTVANQKHSSVAIDKNGDFVVTWSSGDPNVGDYDVYFQRFNRGGQKLRFEQQVNTLITAGDQTLSRVAMDDDGDFIITWVSEGQDGDGTGIFAKRFDNQGTAYGPEFQVNTFFTGTQTLPAVAANRDGDFAIAWTGQNADGSSLEIFSQNYNFGNAPTDITLNPGTAFGNTNADVRIGTLVTTDPDANDTFTYSLVTGMGDTDNGRFYINGDGLITLTPIGPVPMATTFSIRVRSVDSGGFAVEDVIVINVPSDNTAPLVQLINQVNVLPELTDVSNDVRVANILITDDGIGDSTPFLGGPDAADFIIVGNELRLRAGTSLDFEVKKTYTVTVFVDDPDIGGSPDGQDTMTITITRLPQTAPTLAAFGLNVAWRENALPVVLTTTATVTDPDSPNFNTGTLTVSLVDTASPSDGNDANDRLTIRNQGVMAGQVSLIGNSVLFRAPNGNLPVTIGTFTGGTGATPLVITFNSQATAAGVQAVLRNIVYSNVGTFPNIFPTRTVQAVLTDGDGGTSNVVTKTIVITGINTPPVVSNFDPNLTYLAGSAAVLVDNNAQIVDLDSPNLSGGVMAVTLTANGHAGDRLTIRNQGNGPGQIGVVGNQIRFGNVLIGTFTGGSGTTPLRIFFNAASSPAAAEALLRNIQFNTISAVSPTTSRSVQVILTDGDGGTSISRSKQIAVFMNNQDPVITGFGVVANYAKGGGPLLISMTATITDTDSPNFAGGVLAFTLLQNGEATDRLTIRHQGFGFGQIGVSGSNVSFGGTIIGTFTGGIGLTSLVITFNAAATPAAATALIRNLQFQSVSANPSGVPRLLQATLTDGDGGMSNIALKTINVNLVRPTVNGFTFNLNYIENQAPIVLAAMGSVTDFDSPSFAGGNLFLSLETNGSADDRLTVAHIGVGPGQIGVVGNNVLFGNVVFGTISGGVGGDLSVTFNANATRDAVSALIRALRYSNVSETPSTLVRRLLLQVTDDNGNTSLPVYKNITVFSVNDVPVLGNVVNPAVTYSRSAGTAVFLTPQATVSDLDQADFNNGRLTFQLVNNVQATDLLQISSQGFALGQVGVTGNTVFYSGVAVGTFSGGTGLSPLVITFNSSSNAESVQAVARRITYLSTSPLTTLVARTVRVSLTDGDGGSTAVQSKQITIVL